MGRKEIKEKTMQARLILSDGTHYEGLSFGKR